MIFFVLTFLLGDVYLQTFSSLPSWYLFLSILPAILIIKFFKPARYLSGFLLGFFLTLFHAKYFLTEKEQLFKHSVPHYVAGVITTIPKETLYGTQFLFKINHYSLKLLWHTKKVLAVGQKWRLFVRLKQIHGLANLGTFDYEASAFKEHILAAGTVVDNSNNKLLIARWYYAPINYLRAYIKTRLLSIIPDDTIGRWLIALAIGDRNNINSSDWEVLRNTGTNHLMAIAGLHIGVIAAFFYFIANKLWRLWPKLLSFYPAQKVGIIASLISAFIYAAFAGFSLPTLRALIMLTVFLTFNLLQRVKTKWYSFAAALFLVLCLNPFDVLDASFWLSFGTVAFIIYRFNYKIKSLFMQWFMLQLIITVSLIPFTLWFFQQISFISFFVNIITIPVVGFIIVPIIFFATLISLGSLKLAAILFAIAYKILYIVWQLLSFSAHMPFAVWHHYINFFTFIILLAGTILLLSRLYLPFRLLGLTAFLVLLIKPSLLHQGEMQLTVLDVGQGLATIIRTAQHTLIFDTGAKWSDASDMGKSVLLPFLQSKNIRKIDLMVISHGDNDHAGGAVSLLKQERVLKLVTSVPEKFFNATYCFQGQKWIWDGVYFEFLYPNQYFLHLNNDSSCVLKINNAKHTILLTGDIEKLAENYLHKTYGARLASDIIVAPHHGSKTSALAAFLLDVKPNIVIFSTGYKNRYHFPQEKVIKQYQELHSQLFDTAKDGAIELTSLYNKKALQIHTYRKRYLYYYHWQKDR